MNISKIQITITSADPNADPLTIDVIGTADMTVNHSTASGTNDVSLRINGSTDNKDIATFDGMQRCLDMFNELVINYR